VTLIKSGYCRLVLLALASSLLFGGTPALGEERPKPVSATRARTTGTRVAPATAPPTESSVSLTGLLQELTAKDGETVFARIGQREPTRIKVDGAKINEVVGNVYDPQRNPAGELLIEMDKAKGEIFVRPINATLSQAVSLFLSTDLATYALLLKPMPIAAGTIVLRDVAPRPVVTASEPIRDPSTATAPGALPASSFVRQVKALVNAMASDRVPSDVEIRDSGQAVALWTETQFTLQRQFFARSIVGEHYLLTNVSPSEMVLAEPQLYKEGVRGVAIEWHTLQPGESTNVYIVRDRGPNE